MKSAIALALAMLFVCSSCSTGPVVKKDPDVNLAGYHYYQWVTQDQVGYLRLNNPDIDYITGYVRTVRKPGVEDRVRPLVEQVRQRPPFHQLHGEIGPPIRECAQLVDRHDPWMLQLAANLGLLDEPANKIGLVAVRLEQHLDRQVSTEVNSVRNNGPELIEPLAR